MIFDQHYLATCLKSGHSMQQAQGRFFLRALSQFVFDKFTSNVIVREDISDELQKVKQEIEAYCITDCLYDSNTGRLTIQTSRPGVLIGVKGANIYAIEKYLIQQGEQNKMPVSKIELKEDLTPLQDDLMASIISFGRVTSYGDDGHEFGGINFNYFEEPEWDSD